MTVRRRLQQRLFRHALRRLKQQASADEQGLLGLALSEPDVLEMAYEQTMDDALVATSSELGFTITRADDGSRVVDNVLKLFDWFLRNGPSIIQIIKLISEMLGGVAEATVILRQPCSNCTKGACRKEAGQCLDE